MAVDQVQALVTTAPHQGVIRHIKRKFIDEPHVRLTVEEAQRLCRADEILCYGVLNALVDARILHRHRDGAYVLAGDLISDKHPVLE